MSETRDNIEVRLHGDGTLDEIVIYNQSTGRCLFHLEQMSDNYYWMRAYGTTQDLVAHIGATVGTCDGGPIYENNRFIGHEKIEGPKVWADFEWEDSTIEAECGPEYATPAVERRAQIAEVINKYGIACTLQEITDILRGGRKAEHDQALIGELDNARTKFLADDKAYWNAIIESHD